MDQDCEGLTGKNCDGAQPVFANLTAYRGILAAIMGKKADKKASPNSDLVTEVYIDQALPKLSPDGTPVKPPKTVLKFSVRPKPAVKQAEVRVRVRTNIDGEDGSLAQFDDSWKPIEVRARDPSAYENANGIARYRALNAADGRSINCWWLTLRPKPRYRLRVRWFEGMLVGGGCACWLC